MFAFLLLPFSLIAGTAAWWRNAAIRILGLRRPLGTLTMFRAGRSIVWEFRRNPAGHALGERVMNYIPVVRRLRYYRNATRRTVEFRNLWSRGVVGGFINVNFVGQQPPARHGNARVSLILHGRKIPTKPLRFVAGAQMMRGGSLYRRRLARSPLGR